MKLLSWNVNGIRAVIKKGFFESMEGIDADVICIQEIKALEEQVEDEFKGYIPYWNSAERKGYSGTLTLTKVEPISVSREMGNPTFDKEGRCLTLEFEKFYLVNVYTPNSKRGLERLDERMIWEDELKAYLKELNKTKPVILCGDLNVAHEEIDLANPKTNRRNAGFTDEEREKMTKLLEAGFIDSFRYLYPDKTQAYSWWSYFGKAREKNVGWRIDYFITSKDLKDNIKEAGILPDIYGSDHCPVTLDVSI